MNAMRREPNNASVTHLQNLISYLVHYNPDKIGEVAYARLILDELHRVAKRAGSELRYQVLWTKPKFLCLYLI